MKRRTSYNATLFLPLLFVCIGLEQSASARQSTAVAPRINSPLSGEQVVEKLVAMNLERAQALHAYQGTRLYRIQYRGFFGSRSAEMSVDVKYQAPSTKQFTVRSATGSKLIIGKVFKKLLQAEQDAMGAKAQRRTALNNANYEFALVGYESTPAGSMYILSVKPKTKEEFLFRGRIWVNAEDFAVTRLEAQPEKNPSFWTRHSDIDEVYMRVGDFWLPAHSHSVTNIRFGGHAILTIQYQNYEITSASLVSGLPKCERLFPEGRETPHSWLSKGPELRPRTNVASIANSWNDSTEWGCVQERYAHSCLAREEESDGRRPR
jgi:hypothetical protein